MSASSKLASLHIRQDTTSCGADLNRYLISDIRSSDSVSETASGNEGDKDGDCVGKHLGHGDVLGVITSHPGSGDYCDESDEFFYFQLKGGRLFLRACCQTSDGSLHLKIKIEIFIFNDVLKRAGHSFNCLTGIDTG